MTITQLKNLANSFAAYLETKGYDRVFASNIVIKEDFLEFEILQRDNFQQDLNYSERFQSGLLSYEAPLEDFNPQVIWDKLEKVPSREIRELTILAQSTAGTVAMKDQLKSAMAQQFVEDITATRNILRIAS